MPNAKLGAKVDRYSFFVRLLPPLLHTGLARRTNIAISNHSRSSLVVPGLFISRRTPAPVAPKPQRTPREFLRIPKPKQNSTTTQNPRPTSHEKPATTPRRICELHPPPNIISLTEEPCDNPPHRRLRRDEGFKGVIALRSVSVRPEDSAHDLSLRD